MNYYYDYYQDDRTIELKDRADKLADKFSFTESTRGSSSRRPYGQIRVHPSFPDMAVANDLNYVDINPEYFFAEPKEIQDFVLAHEMGHIEQRYEKYRPLRAYEALGNHNLSDNNCKKLTSIFTGTCIMSHILKYTLLNRCFAATAIACTITTIASAATAVACAALPPFRYYLLRQVELDADRRAALALGNVQGGIKRFSGGADFEQHEDLQHPYRPKFIRDMYRSHPSYEVRLAQMYEIQKTLEEKM